MRKIPATMATQHPDNASTPYWSNKPFISTGREIQDCYRSFSDLGIQEYNWDWEGKFVDEAVLDRLYHDYGTYFSEHSIGKDIFLTFRIPNPRIEKQQRLARAFMVMLTGAELAKAHNFYSPPLFEIILPLTETSTELMDLQEAFSELVSLKHRLLAFNGELNHLDVIPLFEQVEKIIDSVDVLEGYVALYKQKFGSKPPYIRPYCARSDPALNSGLIPTVLAIKIALSNFLDFTKQKNIPLYPMIGAGSLPFRGSLRPDNVMAFANEYQGIRTTTVQSAFRYDFPENQVRESIAYLNAELPVHEAKHLDPRQKRLLKEAIPLATDAYRETIEQIAPFIHQLALDVPVRRERHLHVGLFGYSRGLGKIQLPRAIPFTAVLYSFGIPPEIIGTGRGLSSILESGLLPMVEQSYRHMRDDLLFAARFVNIENIQRMAKKIDAFKSVLEDVQSVQNYLGITVGPVTKEEKKHFAYTEQIMDRFDNGDKITDLIEESGFIRHSLG